MKKAVIITLMLFCLVPLASADVEVTLTVDWNLFIFPLYTGTVCIGNTDLFGIFDTIIMEYSRNDHSDGVPSPRDVFFQHQGGNVYCANLEPAYWDSTSDTLDNIKITIKNNKDVIFQDDKWSTDAPLAINDSNHLFHNHRATFNISLNQGWNLISMPLTPLNNSVDNVFESISYSKLFSYDSGWKVPTEINPKFGYWINVDNDSIFSVNGFRPENPSINNKKGWNLIGYPYLEETNISQILENVTVLTYNNSQWYSYHSNRPSYLDTLYKFTPGFGYWVYSLEE